MYLSDRVLFFLFLKIVWNLNNSIKKFVWGIIETRWEKTFPAGWIIFTLFASIKNKHFYSTTHLVLYCQRLFIVISNRKLFKVRDCKNGIYILYFLWFYSKFLNMYSSRQGINIYTKISQQDYNWNILASSWDTYIKNKSSQLEG